MKSLINRIHSINKEKGFWDKPRNLGEMFMLTISELGECLEAHRKGRFAPEAVVPFEAFEVIIKDTFEDEIADTYIRVCDMIGGLYGDKLKRLNFSFYPEFSDPHNVGENLLWLTKVIMEAYDGLFLSQKEEGFDLIHFHGDARTSKSVFLYGVLAAIEHFCFLFDIDLMRFVELKLKYNATRPKLHGKNY